MIGWNASPEARRAVSDSMSLLVAATSVTALIVDPPGCKWLGEQAGCDIYATTSAGTARMSMSSR